MTFPLLQTATFIAIVVVSPVAPWWAGPAYVAATEHVIETLGSALIVAVVSASVQVWQGRKTRSRLSSTERHVEEHIDVKRTESKSEHQQGLDAAERREVNLAAKVEAAAQNLAARVAGTTATIVGAIAENTAITHEAKDASKEAAAVANHVNDKIAGTLGAIKIQQEQEAARQDAASNSHDRRADDPKA